MIRALLLCICLLLAAGGRTIPLPDKKSALWNNFQQAENDGSASIILLQLAELSNAEGNLKMSDSLFNMAVEEMKMQHNHRGVMAVYAYYLRESAGSVNQSILLQQANDMVKTAKQCNENNCLAKAHAMLGSVYLNIGETRKALDESNAGYYYATHQPDLSLQIDCQLNLGDARRRNNELIEAYKNYLSASLLAERTNNIYEQAESYQRLAEFYSEMSNYDSAIAYKQRQMQLSRSSADSDQLMRQRLELADYYFAAGVHLEGSRRLHQIIRYAMRRHNISLRDDAFQLYRSNLINAGNLAELARLYQDIYPEEYARIAREDTSQYYRLKAYICAAQGVADSSAIYFGKAAMRMRNEDYSPYYLSYFYLNYGRCLSRQHRLAESIAQLKLAYYYSLREDYLPYLIPISHELDTTYYQLHQTDSAYIYKALFHDYSTRWERGTTGRELLRQSIDAETERQKLLLEKAEHARHVRHMAQYTFITFSIAACFTILLLLGLFKVRASIVRGTGLFAFVSLFEFIVMITDNWIEHATGGEPWKIILFKVGVILILTPLHHRTEKKVLHYLSEHQLMLPNKIAWRQALLRIAFRGKPRAVKPAIRTEGDPT